MTNEKAASIAAFLFLIVRQRFIKSIDIQGQHWVLIGYEKNKSGEAARRGQAGKGLRQRLT